MWWWDMTDHSTTPFLYVFLCLFLSSSQALDNYLAIAILRTKDPLDSSHLLGGLEENLPHSLRPFSPTSPAGNGLENILEMDPSDPDGSTGDSPTTKETLVTATRRGNKLVFDGKGPPPKETEPELRGVYR